MLRSLLAVGYRKRLGAFARVGIVVCGLGLAASAWAVVIPPPTWRLANGFSIARDGVLLFEVLGGVEGRPPPPLELEVSDGALTPIAGTVERLDLESDRPFAIFRPEVIWPVDQVLNITGATVDISPSIDRSVIFTGAPPMRTNVSFDIEREPVRQACCTRDGVEDTCFDLVTKQKPRVHISLIPELANTATSAQQFLYKAELTQPPEEAPTEPWQPRTASESGFWLVAAEEADKYCFKMRAFRLVDGARFELAERCDPSGLGPLEDLGPSTSVVEIALDIYNCPEPPDHFEEAWCFVNVNGCAQGPNVALCESADYDARCDRYDSSSTDLATLIVEARRRAMDDAGVSDFDDKDGDAAVADADVGESSGAGGGCSVPARARSPRSSAVRAWITVLGLLALRRRAR